MEQQQATQAAPPQDRNALAIASIRRHIEEQIDQHRQNLVGWREPDGHLLPTEPDPDERKAIRIQLMAAIETLKKVDSHIVLVASR